MGCHTKCREPVGKKELGQLDSTSVQLHKKMQQLYLQDLQRIERICVRLHLLQPNIAAVQRLRSMNIAHIRPLIALLKVRALIQMHRIEQ